MEKGTQLRKRVPCLSMGYCFGSPFSECTHNYLLIVLGDVTHVTIDFRIIGLSSIDQNNMVGIRKNYALELSSMWATAG